MSKPELRSLSTLLVVISVLAAGLGLNVVRFGLSPIGSVRDDLFWDSGVNYLMAEGLAHGKVLYRDLQFPYGPVPAYLFSGFTRIFGNSPASYWWFIRLGSLVHILLGMLLLIRYCRAPAALSLGILGLVPLATGWGTSPSSFVTFEQICLTGIALLWRPPWERTFRRSLALGLILGLQQEVKFGGAFLALATLLAFDCAALWTTRNRLTTGWGALRQTWSVVLVFGVMEASRWGLLLATLPFDVAWDCIWPGYTRGYYRTIPEQFRSCPFFHFFGIRHFLYWHLVPIAGMVFALAALAHCFVQARSQRAMNDELKYRCNLLFLPAFYGVAWIAGYLGLQHHYYAYAWCLLFGIAALPVWRGPVYVTLLSLLLLPEPLLLLKRTVREWMGMEDPIETVRIGGYYFASGGVYQGAPLDPVLLLEKLRSLAGDRPPQVLMIPIGAGFHHFAGLELPTRHMWVIPSYVRPYEMDGIRQRFRELTAVVHVNCAEPPATTLRDVLLPVFGEEITADLGCRNVQRIDFSPNCVIFPLRPDASAAVPPDERGP